MHCIEASGYHGGDYNGPNCMKILSKIHELTELMPENLKKFGRALDAFNEVRISVFGQTLDQDFAKKIKNFEKAYEKLEIPVTPKIHAIFTHVLEWCTIHEESLGPYSEQAGETLHSDFKKTWVNYYRPPTHPKYSTHLLNAVVTYNSLHL